MSVNYEISDIFNYAFDQATTPMQTSTGSANANTGLMFRDAANDGEVRLIGPGTEDQVLKTTATNVIGWADATAFDAGPFRATPALAQAIASTALSTFTTVVWGTETIDPGGNFASNLYTIPIDGVYNFHTTVEWATTSKSNKGERHTRIVEDPGGTPTILTLVKSQPNPDKSITFFQQVSVMYDATLNETIGVQVSQDSGASNDVGVGSQFYGLRVA
jgi:hypothetical protein